MQPEEVAEYITKSTDSLWKYTTTHQFIDKHGKRHLVPYEGWNYWVVEGSDLILLLKEGVRTDGATTIKIEYESEEDALKEANWFYERWAK